MTTQTPPGRFVFTGTGEDYFRIWITNTLLTLLTLGVYSAWAKVRRLKYFHNNLSLDGGVFDYHGDPKAILRGRMIVVPVIFLAGFLGGDKSHHVLFLLYLACGPWAIVTSLRFQAANTSYRGLRFTFVGKLPEAYRLISLEMLYVMLSFGLLYPLWRYRFRRFVFSNLRYGDKAFQFGAPLGSFFGGYALCGFFGTLTIVVLVASLAGMFAPYLKQGLAAAVVAGYVVLAAIYALILLVVVPYLIARNRNLIFNHLGLGPDPAPEELRHPINPLTQAQSTLHRFISTLTYWRVFAVQSSNLLLTLLTFGLYRPFAAVRSMRLLTDNTLFIKSPLQDAARSQAVDQAGVVGAEAGDVGGLDLGL